VFFSQRERKSPCSLTSIGQDILFTSTGVLQLVKAQREFKLGLTASKRSPKPLFNRSQPPPQRAPVHVKRRSRRSRIMSSSKVSPRRVQQRLTRVTRRPKRPQVNFLKRLAQYVIPKYSR
jgi:hypothetical protein